MHLVTWSVNQRSLELSHRATLRTSLQALQRGACARSIIFSICLARLVAPCQAVKVVSIAQAA